MSILNISNITKVAQEVSANAPSDGSGGGTNYPYKTLYLKPGDTAFLKIRLLVSAQGSQDIITKYWSHKDPSSGINHSCAYRQGKDIKCPVCDAIEQVKNAKGIDAKGGAVARSIMYAQFISSVGYEGSERYPLPEKGEVFLLLGPGGMYTSIHQLIMSQSDHPANIEKLLAMNESIEVIVNRVNNRANASIGMTPVTSSSSQQEFENLLYSLKPLQEMYDEANETEENIKSRQELADSILRTHHMLGGSGEAHATPMSAPTPPPIQQPAPHQGHPANPWGTPQNAQQWSGQQANVSHQAPPVTQTNPVSGQGVPPQQSQSWGNTYVPGDQLPESLNPVQSEDSLPPHLRGNQGQSPHNPQGNPQGNPWGVPTPSWGNSNNGNQ